jgi:hypothetical protein
MNVDWVWSDEMAIEAQAGGASYFRRHPSSRRESSGHDVARRTYVARALRLFELPCPEADGA